MRRLLLFFMLVAIGRVHPAHAQGLISAGVGLGGALGDRHKDSGESGRHGAAYVQLHVPVFPIALRVDGLLTKPAGGDYSKALLADAVYVLPIPVVQPYALAGYGRYNIGNDAARSGWNAGLGARVRTPVLSFSLEARRHQRMQRDLITIGISR